MYAFRVAHGKQLRVTHVEVALLDVCLRQVHLSEGVVIITMMLHVGPCGSLETPSKRTCQQ